VSAPDVAGAVEAARFPRWRRRLLLPLLGGAAASLLWLAGLIWFASSIPHVVEDPDSQTDAIVVLTGGRLRVDSGLALFAHGHGRKLFISGVNPGVDLNELLRVSPHMPKWVQCCIVLGYAADNTRGNAAETAEWMRRENFRSLRLVTSAYHMRRSLLEFRRAMPDVPIVPHPVFPEHVRQDDWWRWRGTAALIIGEYHKYLAALLRPWPETIDPEKMNPGRGAPAPTGSGAGGDGAASRAEPPSS
jgi:uncharacterized SAM-binding protein YcdF (DUF218 family)